MEIIQHVPVVKREENYTCGSPVKFSGTICEKLVSRKSLDVC